MTKKTKEIDRMWQAKVDMINKEAIKLRGEKIETERELSLSKIRCEDLFEQVNQYERECNMLRSIIIDALRRDQ